MEAVQGKMHAAVGQSFVNKHFCCQHTVHKIVRVFPIPKLLPLNFRVLGLADLNYKKWMMRILCNGLEKSWANMKKPQLSKTI